MSMESKTDSTNGTPPSAFSGESVKRPIENHEPVSEANVKHIKLDPVVTDKEPRRKRKKYAIFLSYSGKNYLGMQRNHGFKTIEGDLLDALLKANLINQEEVLCPQLAQFQRAARTDKGVSAARQVVSVKLPDDAPDMVTEVNKHLCDQIQVMAIKRVTKSFNCKTKCDSRTYSYMCPTFAFAPIDVVTKEDYRVTPEILSQLRSILQLYKGTHNFHNFTARKKFEEDSAKRYMIDISAEDPFERDGLEWIVIRIKGQSFMLHQIRKMVGLAIAVIKGFAAKDVIHKAYEKNRIDVPIAPGLGLVLEEPHYDKYNKRFGNDGIHETLAWTQYEDRLKTFRQKFIDSNIVETEKSEKSMLQWLGTLPLHTYDVRLDGPPIAPGSKQTPSQIRSAFGRANVRVGMGKEDSDEEDAEMEDEGDLDKYRIKPIEKEDTNAVPTNEGDTNTVSTNEVESPINGEPIEKKDTNAVPTNKGDTNTVSANEVESPINGVKTAENV